MPAARLQFRTVTPQSSQLSYVAAVEKEFDKAATGPGVFSGGLNEVPGVRNSVSTVMTEERSVTEGLNLGITRYRILSIMFCASFIMVNLAGIV
jgi:hypothetical protein